MRYLFLGGGVILLGLSVAHAQPERYATVVPTSGDATLYYDVGGGDIVPVAPSNHSSVRVSINGLGAVGYNCGRFNPGASVANALNGVKDSAMNMFNQVVSSARGAILEMPAYAIAKANPALYQLMQNGLASGQWDFDLGLSSCRQMQQQIDAGKNPFKNMYDTAMRSKWQALQAGSSLQSVRQLSYTSASSSGISSARNKVDKDNGRSGIEWTHGSVVAGTPHAGGDAQPPINLTYDTVLAGANAVVGRKDWNSTQAFPESEGVSHYFADPAEAAHWAQVVLGEKVIRTAGQSSAQPGQGLLSRVSKQYDPVYRNLVALIDGSQEVTLENLKAVSTQRLMLNDAIIQSLRNVSPMNRTIETSSLAQGVAAMRVINRAQQVIVMLQSARQVPAIATNHTAQHAIQVAIKTLNQQIAQIVDNRQNNDKILTTTITAIARQTEQDISQGNVTHQGVPMPVNASGGVLKR